MKDMIQTITKTLNGMEMNWEKRRKYQAEQGYY